MLACCGPNSARSHVFRFLKPRFKKQMKGLKKRGETTDTLLTLSEMSVPMRGDEELRLKLFSKKLA